MLKPSVIGLAFAALSATVVAAPAGWFARDLVFNWHDRPAIVREQVAICTAEVTATAAKATRDEQLRQFRIGEAATEQFLIEQQARADLAEAERERLEQENADYEQKLLAAGRTCGLDSDDLDFLGVRLQSGAATGRSGTGQGAGARGASRPSG